MIDEVHKQVETLAKDAGKRAAARAILRGEAENLTAAQIDGIETFARDNVKTRLLAQFESTGELPPIMTDLVQAAALPKIQQVDGRFVPPVIHVHSFVSLRDLLCTESS